ncbi:MAG: molecular chaperone TorD, partial [Cyanothece sp. SIO1E1]|nr:molecular chaperone TorD [Cyanothece sp. SIO1E1]
IVSQLLSAALDGRTMLRAWPEWVEWGWLLLWSGMGSALGWRIRSPGRVAIALIFFSSGLVSGAYLAFLFGWWLPIVPPIMGLMTASILLLILTNRQLEKNQLRQTTQLLAAISQTQPVAGQIAIEYLKQSESEENQGMIEFVIRNS